MSICKNSQIIPSVLHVVVGYSLPIYFLNAVKSVRLTAPADSVLVIDNASPTQDVRIALEQLADSDPKIDLILRTSNDLLRNRKVGSLYDAYEEAFQWAIDRRFDLLHLIQGDFQMLWWDADFVNKSWDIFSSNPRCVNILTQFLSRDTELTDSLLPAANGQEKLRKYGLTDTGIYHLGRWKAEDMHFGSTEQGHALRYLDEGLEVLCHPWPTDAAIPWPAVIRNGVQRGREIRTEMPFIIKPLTPDKVADLKHINKIRWLEDACIPWGWTCATPMWTTGLDSFDYWILRYRDAKRNGLANFWPRFDIKNTERKKWHAVIKGYRYRPPLHDLILAAPIRGIVRRLKQGSK